MQHYVPLHPSVVDTVTPLLDCRNRKDDTHILAMNISTAGREGKIPLVHDRHFVCSHLRKFAELYADISQWDQSNRAYILTHGVSGVEWSHYKHPLPEYVYDVYILYWKDTNLCLEI